MSLEQTAQAIGLSKGWVCRMRNKFITGEAVGDQGKSVHGGWHRENFTPEREAELLKPFLESAGVGGILVVGQIKLQLEAALGRKMALSSVYKLLHRHNWRKLAPDKRHPQSDPVRRKTGKKLAKIRQNWAQGEPVRLMFRDGARFERINDVRRCRAPKPIRPLCQAMLTHEYAYAAVEAKAVSSIL